ncbi:MAG: hypothetical protein WD708_12760 [Kiritimatiellia bacterium]
MKIFNRTHCAVLLYVCVSSAAFGDLGKELVTKGLQVFKENRNIEDTILFTKAAARYYELENRTNNVYYATSLQNLGTMNYLLEKNHTAKKYYTSGLKVYKNIKYEHFESYANFLKDFVMFAQNKDQSSIAVVLDEMLSTIKDDKYNEKTVRSIIDLFINPKNERPEYSEIQKIVRTYSEGLISFNDMRAKLENATLIAHNIQTNTEDKSESSLIEKTQIEREAKRKQTPQEDVFVNRSRPSRQFQERYYRDSHGAIISESQGESQLREIRNNIRAMPNGPEKAYYEGMLEAAEREWSRIKRQGPISK